jgi:uncharacterized membrane protein YccC
MQPEEQIDGANPWSRLAKLRANLSFQSAAFRHAIRLAVCVGVGDAMGRAVDLERTYWIPMTISIVLRPDFSATFSRGILRILGTLAGLLVATGLFHVLSGNKTTEIALIAVFAFFLRWIGPANYGVLVTALSAFIVLFIAMTGVSPVDVISARAVNTLIGGAIALVAYTVWPTWERTLAGPVFANLLDSYRAYFDAVLEIYRKQAPFTPEASSRERRKARLARSNVEALIGRVVAEPGLAREKASLLSAMLTTSHGFVRAVLAIESAADRAHLVPARPAAIAFAAEVASTLESMANSLRSNKPLPDEMPDLREAHNAILASTGAVTDQYTLVNTETDRIATSLNTLGEQIAKYIGSAEANNGS